MPIYEYACLSCGEAFELIVRRSTVPECPGCGSSELEKQLSAFAVGRAESLPVFRPNLGAGCASCPARGDPEACHAEHG